MDALNTFFKEFAEKIGLPAFFKGTTLLFNNFFLAAVAAGALILLLLTAILIPGKGRNAKSYYRAAERK